MNINDLGAMTIGMDDANRLPNEQSLFAHNRHSQDNETEAETAFGRVKELCATRDWLKQQLSEFKTNLKINSEDNSVLNDIEVVETNLHRLKKEVQHEAVNQMLKKLMLQRLQEAELMTKLLSTERSCVGEGELSERSAQCKKLQELLETQRGLCTDVLTQHEMTEEIQPKIDDLKKKVQELKIKIRLLMQELHTLQNEKEHHTALSRKNAQIARTQEKLSETKAMVAIVMGVFKRLIIGSQIDWVHQEYLCKIMLDKDTES